MEKQKPDSIFRLPFSTYDVFAYLIPGTALIGCILFFEYWLRLKNGGADLVTPFYSAAKMSAVLERHNEWAISAVFLLTMFSIAYAMGHLVASLSSFAIDRIFVCKMHGYPYVHLLKIKEGANSQQGKWYWSGLFLWVNVSLVMLYLGGIGESRLWWLPGGVLGGYAAVVAAINRFVRRGESMRWSVFWERWWSGPYWALASIPSSVVDTKRSFNEDFIQQFKQAFQERFGISADKSEDNCYWLSYCYLVDKSEEFTALAVNWLNLYGYARNLAMAFYLAAIYCGFSLVLQSDLVRGGRDLAVLFPVVMAGLFLVMLQRFYHLYKGYFTKFIFRAFVYLNTVKERPSSTSPCPLNDWKP